MYKVDPVNNDRYTCFQALLAALAAFYGTEYKMMFSESWHNYGKLPVTRETLFKGHSSLLMLDKLSEFHGLKGTIIKYTSHGDFVNTLAELLETSPVLFFCDEYYLPGNYFYHKEHIPHGVLATAFDQNTQELSFIDAYAKPDSGYSVRAIDLPLEKGNLYSFEFVGIPHLSVDRYLSEFRKNREYMKTLSLPDLLDDSFSLLQKLETVADFAVEGQEVNSIEVLMRLKRIGGSKINYCEFLSYCFKKLEREEKIDAFLSIARDLSDRYANLRLFIAKEIISKRFDLEIRGKIIEDILLLEKSALGAFMDIQL